MTAGGPPGFPDLPPGRQVDLPGRGSTFVREGGAGRDAGRDVLLLHGLTSTADLCWFSTFPLLTGSHRVVAPDMRGHGSSSFRGPVTLEALTGDAAALIEVLGLSRPIVAGFSMGGVVAQLLWNARPDLCSGLVLCATASDWRPETLRQRAEMAVRGSTAALLRLAPSRVSERAERLVGGLGRSRTTVPSDDPLRRWAQAEIARSPARGVLEATVALRRADTTSFVRGIDVPTAVVVPESDTVVDPARQERLASSIPGSHVLRLPGPHALFIEDPHPFGTAVAEAVAWVESRGAKR
ncbi:MAG TPA: alpha/beta hydrolase [Acidimicrobiales bacterium]|nr:alpha/beta hydrolase [Acidimicrobiales bacterium]